MYIESHPLEIVSKGRMPTCILCGSGQFDEFDGHFYCDKCGTQSQEIRNEAEVEEDADNFVSGHSQRRQMTDKKKKTNRRSKYPPTDFGRPWLTFEAFQCLLKAQVNSLIKLGVNPALKETVCQIWFHFLRKKKVAFTGAAEGSRIAFENMKFRRDRLPGNDDDPLPRKNDKCKKNVENNEISDDTDEEFYEDDLENIEHDEEIRSNRLPNNSGSEEYDSSQSESESEPEHIGSVMFKYDNKRGGWAQLQHKLTIVLIYIGLLYTKEPITASDLLRLIARGNLPFYKVSEILPGHMKFSQQDTATFLTRPVRIRSMHVGITFIINHLDLPPIPEPNLHLIIVRLILDLQLPAAVHRLAISLLSASGFKPRTNFRCRRETKCNEFYEEISMAFIIVAVKLIYGLDGNKERNGYVLRSMLDVPSESLECWSCISLRLYKKRKTAIQKTYPIKEDDLQFVKNTADYSLFCVEEIFSNFNDCVSRTPTNDVHLRYRACRKAARDEYQEIMQQALNDLTKRQAKDQVKLKAKSFVYEHVPEDEHTSDWKCKCKRLATEINKNIMDCNRPGEDNDDPESYLIYLNDLSGLKVHDSYKFFLNICAERILLRPIEMHDYVTYVESMLFTDPEC